MTSLADPTLAQLEQSAMEVITILKNMPEFSNFKIVVIGGLAVWKYLRRYRTTQDVDYLITVPRAPKAVKEKLLAIPGSLFKDYAGTFVYSRPGLPEIQIDMTPGDQSPYIPESAQVIATIAPETLPYISMVDLIVFKINSCGIRSERDKMVRDATDAQTLLHYAASQTPLSLTEQQKSVVLGGLLDVLKVSSSDETWWKKSLGL